MLLFRFLFVFKMYSTVTCLHVLMFKKVFICVRCTSFHPPSETRAQCALILIDQPLRDVPPLSLSCSMCWSARR